MRYETISDIKRKGLNEALKAKINNLEWEMETGDTRDIEEALQEFYYAKEIAESFGFDVMPYDDVLIEKSKELRERWGIEIR